MHIQPEPYRIIRRSDLHLYVGLKRTQVDELIKNGEFPKPVTLSDGGRAVGWLAHEIAQWQAMRIAKRDGAAA